MKKFSYELNIDNNNHSFTKLNPASGEKLNKTQLRKNDKC